MSTVKEIETAIRELPRGEFMALANVIAAHQAALWEKQDDTDSAASLEFLYEGEEAEEQFETDEELEHAGF
mgnify:CR=1 FL=1